jgi:hypothetical protein
VALVVSMLRRQRGDMTGLTIWTIRDARHREQTPDDHSSLLQASASDTGR